MFQIDSTTKDFWKEQFKELVGRYPTNVWDLNTQVNKNPKSNKINNISTLNFPFGQWFKGESINPIELCIKRYIEKGWSNEIAIYSVKTKSKSIEKFSYSDLNNIVLNFSNWFNNEGLQSNDKVLLIGDHGIEMAGLMLSSASLKVIFSICFRSIQAEEIIRRVEMLSPRAIIFTANPSISQHQKLMEIGFNEIKKIDRKDSISHLIMYKRGLDYIKKDNPLGIDSNSSMFALFTSGSTGMPKGIVHSRVGYLLFSYFTTKYFWNFSSGETMFCASDAGWINGHTYSLFGPLLCGGKTILIDDPSALSGVDLSSMVIKETKANCFYLPVALIRLKKSIGSIENDLSHIRAIGSMGEPLAPSLKEWYAKTYLGDKKQPVVNTYFQTETGGILCANRANEDKTCPSDAIGPISNYLSISSKDRYEESELLVKNPWPGCANHFFGEYSSIKKYITNNGYYRLSDIGSIQENYLYVNGRSDDIIIIQGKNISSTFIESVCLSTDEHIQEAVAFTMHDDMDNILLCIGLTLRKGYTKSILKSELRKNICTASSSAFIVRRFYESQKIPKSKSGKILRKDIRKEANKFAVNLRDRKHKFQGKNRFDGSNYNFILI